VTDTESHGTITWLGHATALLEIGGVRLLTDPVIRNRIGPLVRIAAPVPPDAVGRIDVVLLSHLHADHADLPSLRQVATRVPVLVPRGSAEWLRRAGLTELCELVPGDRVSILGVSIRATRAVHDARRRPLGPTGDPLGYVVEGPPSAYFAGDTDLFEEMADLHDDVDVALLPVWGWGRRLGPGHLDPERAARAAAMIEPRVAIPIHWGTYALGLPSQRPSDSGLPARKFAELTHRLAPSVDVRVLEPGERTQL
jgi:L-ascorbate metabolism protein UlaG (beta-lactamase superfamily)